MKPKFHSLVCPIDGDPLAYKEKQLICASGHCFDIAKQGYVNLLPVQHKKSTAPGDSKAMIVARKRFLNSDIYKPVLKQLSEAIRGLKLEAGATILDAGCGEGYYTRHLALEFPQYHFIGLDISKDALKSASNNGDLIDWIVASNSQPPLAPASIELIICIFGFHSFAGFSKVLAMRGKIILVDPAEKHLLELREKIYEQVKLRSAYSIADASQYQLTLLREERLQFVTQKLTKNQLQDLLAMTPHLFRATSQGKIKAKTLDGIHLTVDMIFRMLSFN